MNAAESNRPQREKMANSGPLASPSLRIAVVGLGGIGSAFASQLAGVGHQDVTAIARPASVRLEQLQRDKGVVDSKGRHAAMQVAAQLPENIPYDLVIVTMPANRVDAILPDLERSMARHILFMFNNFNPERLREAVGAERCSFGMPFLQAFVDQDGRLDATIGAGGQKCKMSDPRWVSMFNDSGLPAVLEPNMLLWLRCHVPLCIAFESVSVAGMRRGGGASWGEAMTLASGAQEGFALIQRLGYRLYPAGKAWLHACPAWVLAGMLWSASRVRSFRELLATAADECGSLVDVLLENAAKVSPPISLDKIRAMKPAPKGD